MQNETTISGSDTAEAVPPAGGGLGVGSVTDPSALLNTVTSITKQRIKLNVKVLGVQLGPTPEGSASAANAQGQSAQEKSSSYREQFMAPEMSIVSKFMSKVSQDKKCQQLF